MKARSFHHLLRTTPISPHSPPPLAHPRKPIGKTPRPPGDPVAPPKQYPRFVPPPTTGLNNLSLALDVVLPGEAAEVETDGALVFHSVGDTGGYHCDEVGKAVSHALDKHLTQTPSSQPRLSP